MNFSSQEIADYCLEKSNLPHEVCDQLEVYTRANIAYSQMLIGKMEASFLGFLIKLIKAKRILEIGTYTGYSALAMAQHLPADGTIITLDISEKHLQVAKEFWKKSEHGPKIQSILGPAMDSLNKIKSQFNPSQDAFDLVFIDADKENYLPYLQSTLPLLSSKGLIAIDNCLWSGKVIGDKDTDPDTVAIRKLNDYIGQSEHLYGTLLPIRDGIFLVQPT